MGSYLLLIIAALAAGLINSVAGGGMFLTFPALVFTGVPSIIANASSTTAIIPGILASAWAYREDFRKSENFPFLPLLIVSLAGGIVGALLLLFTPQRTFDSVIPWLMLAATLLFTFGARLKPILKRAFHIGPVAVVVIQFFIAIYGGYFGGAIGIVMLATWTVFGLTDIHVMNANRTLMGAAANSVAAALVIIARKVWWPPDLGDAGGRRHRRLYRRAHGEESGSALHSGDGYGCQRGDYDRVFPPKALRIASSTRSGLPRLYFMDELHDRFRSLVGFLLQQQMRCGNGSETNPRLKLLNLFKTSQANQAVVGPLQIQGWNSRPNQIIPSIAPQYFLDTSCKNFRCNQAQIFAKSLSKFGARSPARYIVFVNETRPGKAEQKWFRQSPHEEPRVRERIGYESGAND